MSLSDEQKKNLSAVAKRRSRDSKGRLLPATTAQEARITELEVSNAYNAAEVIRLAESLRLAEMGRDKAIVERDSAREISDRALGSARRESARRMEQIDTLGNDKDALVLRIEELTETTEEYKSRIAELEEARRMGEFRYIALQRQRTTEFAITAVVMLVGTLLFAGIVVVMGGAGQ